MMAENDQKYVVPQYLKLPPTRCFKIYVDQRPLPDVEISTLMEAWRQAKNLHRENPDSFHEVYRVLEDGRFWGVCQLKPGDCPDCGCPAEECRCLEAEG